MVIDADPVALDGIILDTKVCGIDDCVSVVAKAIKLARAITTRQRRRRHRWNEMVVLVVAVSVSVSVFLW